MISYFRKLRLDLTHYLLLVTVLSLPSFVSAQINIALENPLGEVTSVEAVLILILNAFIIIATPIIVLYIIYAGFLYVSARGNVEQTKQATASLTYAIIGAVILLGAVALSEIVANIVGSFTAE